MAEQHALTTPIVPSGPSKTAYTVRRVLLAWDEQLIQIELRDNNNELSHYVYQGAAANTMMAQLNKVDLSVKSLQRRLLERLASDGLLPSGTVTGVPL